METLKKFKITAAVLTVGLLTSTSIHALANETEKVDSSNFETVNLQDALNNVKEKTTTVEDLQTISTNIPSGYVSNNLFTLSLNIEKISNPEAKAALQKNIDKAIKKWEEKNKTEFPTSDVAVEEAEPTKKGTGPDETTAPVNDEVKKEAKKAGKETRKVAKEAKKTEKKAKKLIEKQERKATHEQKKVKHKEKHAAKKEQRDEKKSNKDHGKDK